MISHIKRLTNIGTALSAEGHIQKLLEMIVEYAMSFTNADGGTLYIVSADRKYLNFEIVRNISLNVRMGGTGTKINWPPVKLVNDDGIENHANVSAHVALTGETVNLQDVYDVEGFDFTGTRVFDKSTQYRSKSMLIVPLRDHENEIIGVLQLLNAQDVRNKSITSFSPEAQSIALSLASQAAVTITKNRLIHDLENLFEAFIRTIAKAIDEKSPYTGGHVRKVADIALMIAEEINGKKDGVYANISLSEDQLKELRIAAWMHDIGKVTTPEYIVDKATKLETKYDRINEIHTRFEVFKRDAELRFLRKRIEFLESGKNDDINQYQKKYLQELKKIEEDLQFIREVNIGSEFMSDEKIKRVESIAKNTWQNDKKPTPWLSEDEVYNLTIRKGTLTNEEREKIQDHVRLTEAMLKELPFPKKLRHVTEYASAHHETLTGTGYHKGLKGDQIPLQARILAFADIFEALSASDRPYKKGKTASEIQKIIASMVNDQHIDKDIYELFFNEGLSLKYIKDAYKPEQIDIPLAP
ncbi:MAG: metal-dependent phosphohydrolase [Planctomycetes bacterium GWF2_39_10]|nr:MAG: metal-dependent phosphohydrolase [Planctomycetes bacterium GWF2_39_10]